MNNQISPMPLTPMTLGHTFLQSINLYYHTTRLLPDPISINQSINLFSQLCNNKYECQQNNVKHSDGIPEKQIAHLSWSPKEARPIHIKRKKSTNKMTTQTNEKREKLSRYGARHLLPKFTPIFFTYFLKSWRS